MLKRALRAFRSKPVPRDEEIRWLWLACHRLTALGRRNVASVFRAPRRARPRGRGSRRAPYRPRRALLLGPVRRRLREGGFAGRGGAGDRAEIVQDLAKGTDGVFHSLSGIVTIVFLAASRWPVSGPGESC